MKHYQIMRIIFTNCYAPPPLLAVIVTITFFYTFCREVFKKKEIPVTSYLPQVTEPKQAYPNILTVNSLFWWFELW